MSEYVLNYTGAEVAARLSRDLTQMTGTLPVANGGTGATSASAARTALGITKANLGLGNVENKSSATIRGELTKSNITTALGYTPPEQDTDTTDLTQMTGILPLSKGGIGSTLNSVPPYAVIRRVSKLKSEYEADGETVPSGALDADNPYLYYTPTNSGAFYATKENGQPQFGTLPIAQGGTGATSASAARTALGLGSLATQDSGSYVATSGNQSMSGRLISTSNSGFRVNGIYNDNGTDKTHEGAVMIGANAGHFGLYDWTNTKWLVYSTLSGNVSLNGNADTATILANARKLKVDLSSTSASTGFDGSANVTDIGVSGTLGLSNGGTGATSASAARTSLGLGTVATHANEDYVGTSGDQSMSGKLVSTSNSGFRVNGTYNSNTHGIGLIVSSSMDAAGLYDYTNSKYIAYCTSNGDVKLNGNATTATTASKADKLTSATKIDGISFDGSADISHYYYNTQNADVTAITANCAGFTLVEGAWIAIKFSKTHTGSSMTLNVNSTGAKNVYFNGSAITSGMIRAYNTYIFVYDGSYYRAIGIAPKISGGTDAPSGGVDGDIYIRYTS